MKRKIYLIEWLDAASRDEWENMPVTLARKPEEFGIPVRTVGYLIRRDKHAITVAHSIGGDDDSCSCGQMAIPRGMIRSMKEIG